MALGLTATGCASLRAEPRDADSRAPARRASVIAHAQVWRPTDVRAIDFRKGPGGPGSFARNATVYCDYIDKQLEGRSPKFACEVAPGDEVKVKFGGTNGEVYGEVLATRLLWALGFGADRMYPVRVICRGCPSHLGGIARPNDEQRFDPAVIERKMAGTEWPPDGRRGWSWTELDRVDSEVGGAATHRDAFKLLAVFLQHTDSKAAQQRILCLERSARGSGSGCPHPFLMINDLGLTFGRANRTNANATSGVNLREWARTPVWKYETGCVGYLPKSFSGTLENPIISERGRRFLAGLLTQLSDRQLHDLFSGARVDLRLRAPDEGSSGFSTITDWVGAFKAKRAQIVERRCA